MSKSYPTIDQKRANASFDASGRSSSEVTERERAIGPSENLTRKLWKLPNEWADKLVADVFGRDKIRSFALAMDPSRAFKTNFQLIDVVKRRRIKGTNGFFFNILVVQRTQIWSNVEVDNPVPVTEYEVQDETYSFYDGRGDVNFTTFFEDSTDKLRKKGTKLSEMRQCKTETNWKVEHLLSYTNVDEYKQYWENPIFYERVRTTTTWYYDKGMPIVAPVDNWGNDKGVEWFEESVKGFVKEQLPAILTPCLTNARQFNAFYQIGELKDLPLMIRKTRQFYDYLSKLVKDPLHNLSVLDKRLGDAYLNKEFGYDSLAQTAAQVMKLPTKIAKRFNYLLDRHGKRTTQRYKRTFKNPFIMGYFYPAVAYLIPASVRYELLEEEQTLVPTCETRTVVNTVVNFPKLAVPKFSDSTFRKLLGIEPTVTDLYNLYPFSWLYDWMNGAGDYLNLVETVINDDDLINYGMITAIVDCKWTIKGKLGIRDRYTEFSYEGDVLSETLGDMVEIPYNFQSHIRYRTRFDIASLEGVKSVDGRNENLSESQKSIIGALLTKFT